MNTNPQTTVQLTVSRIRAYVAAQNISNRKLAEQAGVAETTVRNINKPDWNPTAETIERLERLIPRSFKLPKHDERSAAE